MHAGSPQKSDWEIKIEAPFSTMQKQFKAASVAYQQTLVAPHSCHKTAETKDIIETLRVGHDRLILGDTFRCPSHPPPPNGDTGQNGEHSRTHRDTTRNYGSFSPATSRPLLPQNWTDSRGLAWLETCGGAQRVRRSTICCSLQSRRMGSLSEYIFHQPLGVPLHPWSHLDPNPESHLSFTAAKSLNLPLPPGCQSPPEYPASTTPSSAVAATAWKKSSRSVPFCPTRKESTPPTAYRMVSR